MDNILLAFAAALAIGLPAIATAWAQSKIGSAGAGSLAEKPELSGTIIILVADGSPDGDFTLFREFDRIAREIGQNLFEP